MSDPSIGSRDKSGFAFGFAGTRVDGILDNILYIAGRGDYHNFMIEKVVRKCTLKDWSKIKDDLRYWLSKTSQQRIEAMEFLRRQDYGCSTGLQRIIRVVQRS